MPLQHRLLIAILLITAPLLFVGDPAYDASPTIKAIWNCGHVPFFIVVSLVLLNAMRKFGITNLPKQLLSLFLIILSGSIAVESLQQLIGRDFDLEDIVRNLVGAALATYLDSDLRARLSVRQKILSQTAMSILLLLTAITPARALLSDLAAQRNFPVLLDFSESYELLRIDGNARYRIIMKPELTDSPMLDVSFLTTPYSSVGLLHPPHDWSQHQTLQLHLYNPSGQPLPITVKVYDGQHRESGYQYSDRYNRRLNIGPGWQHISIDLQDIARAPRQRRMDLHDIAGLSLFTTQLAQARQLYIDRIELH